MIDIAKVKIKAGNGGTGIVSFRRDKRTVRGGPNGGDGGKGGDVYFVANENLTTLMDFKAKALFKGENGEPGGKNNMFGASGEDLYLDVPVGTLVKEVQRNGDEKIIADMVKHGEKYLVALGGEGGKGNSRFKSSTNRTPRQFTSGTAGEEKELVLEIKMIADVGLIGFPNAGKSTLLNVLTAANAKIGNYPFTTIAPNLGVMVVVERGVSLVIADLPGLIEGASTGKGLGDEFLRHIARTRLLVHVIDPLFSDPLESYKAIRKELELHNPDLLDKKEILVINKIDVTEVKESMPEIKKMFPKKQEILFVSAATGEGVMDLKLKIAEAFKKLPKIEVESSHSSIKRFTISNLPNKRVVFKGKAEEVEL